MALSISCGRCARSAMRWIARRIRERLTPKAVAPDAAFVMPIASIDDDPDQPVGAAPSRRFGEGGAKYCSGCLVGCCDTHLDAGGAREVDSNHRFLQARDA